MRPAWIRPWVALHNRVASYARETLRTLALVASPGVFDLMRRYPKDSIVTDEDCDALIVIGYADMGAPLLLVRRGPHGDPFVRGADGLAMLYRGGGLTPEMVDVLARAPLGVC